MSLFKSIFFRFKFINTFLKVIRFISTTQLMLLPLLFFYEVFYEVIFFTAHVYNFMTTLNNFTRFINSATSC